MQKGRSTLERGLTLLEATVAMGLVAVFMAGVFAFNTRVVGIARSARDATRADECLRDTLDAIRNLTWVSITDPAAVNTAVFGSTGITAPALPNLVITITVSPYPPPNGAASSTPITIVRAADGTSSVTAAGNGKLPQENTVSARVTATWTGKANRTHEAVSILTKGGIVARH